MRVVKVLVISLLSTSFFLFFLSNINAQWKQTKGPEGGNIQSLVAKEGIIFAGTQNEIYLSKDEGKTWLLNKRKYSRVFLFGSRVYALASNFDLSNNPSTRIIFTENSGQSWTATDNNLKTSYVYSLGFHNGNLYAGTYGKGILFSANNGLSWSSIGDTSKFKHVYSIQGFNDKIFVNTENGVFRSNVNAQNWTLSHKKISNAERLKFSLNNNKIYATTSDSGIIFYNEASNNWQPLTPAFPLKNVNHIYFRGDTIFAASASSIYFMAPKGNSWQIIPPISTKISEVKAIDGFGNNMIVGSNVGIFVSSNYGKTWKESNKGIIASTINALFAVDEYIYAATSIGVFATIDFGNTWKDFNKINNIGEAVSIINVGPHVLAGTNEGVFKNSDINDKWEKVLAGGTGNAFLLQGSKVFAAVGYSLHVSSDTGKTWNEIKNPILNGKIIYQLASNGDNVFAGTNKGIIHSPDNGQNWFIYNNSLSDAEISSLIVFNNMVFAADFWGGLYVSNDNTKSWELLSNESFLSITSYKNLLVSITIDGVYFSQNSGKTWTALKGDPDISFNSIAVSEPFLLAGTINSGLYTKPLTDLQTLSVEQLAEPNDIILEPTRVDNGKISVTLRLKDSSPSHISVYDILGKKIYENDFKGDSKVVEVEFEAPNKSSEILIISLRVHDKILNKKLLIR